MDKLIHQSEKIFQLILTVLLSIIFFVVIGYIYWFSQIRYFTIDEYQYGCMTHLVSQGKLPYVDFYEHHPPLSHFLHSIIIKLSDGNFLEKALLLRKISFSYLILLSISLFFSFYYLTRKYAYALLGAIVPLSVGFGLISSIDYRADCFGAVFLTISILCIDANRQLKLRSLAAVSGILFGMAIFMSQKFVYYGGIALIILFINELNARYLRKEYSPRQLAHPISLIIGFVATVGIMLILCACFGLLPKMIQLIFFDAVKHEQVYPAIHFSSYLQNYLNQTKISTLVLIFLAVYFLVDQRDFVWSAVCFSTIISAFLIKAQYPYNFVFPCFILGICSSRGIYGLAQKLSLNKKIVVNSIFFLVMVLVLYDQIIFTTGKSDNTHQLKLLDKLEKISLANDRFIDNSGGALFLEPATYYFQNGLAQLQLFKKYFSEQIISDYRNSGARFMIYDARQNNLPAHVQEYLRKHYLHLDGDLYTYGLKLDTNLKEITNYEFEVIHPGEYYLFDNIDILIAQTPSNIDTSKLITPIIEISDRCQTKKVYDEYSKLKFPSEITVELMVKVDKNPHNAPVVKRGDWSLLHWDAEFEQMQGMGFQVHLPETNSYVECSEITSLDGWYHVVWTIYGNTLSFYVNGILKKISYVPPKDVASITGNSGAFKIMDAERGHCFNGIAENIRIYPYPMPRQTIFERFNILREKYGIIESTETGNFYKKVAINGKSLENNVCKLEKGTYQLSILPSRLHGYISCVAPQFFIEKIKRGKRHAMYFEY
ncbi:MAG: LamG domain-containing protein [Candidatus Kuenenia sp.]|nr:LamG domain-containing protein [Candidatus Kuenenia hertensis]